MLYVTVVGRRAKELVAGVDLQIDMTQPIPNTIRRRLLVPCLLASAGLVACAPLHDQAGWAEVQLRAALAESPNQAHHNGRVVVSTFRFANGDRLTGHVRNGHVVGIASVAYADGRHYRGEMHQNRIHGQGTLQFPSGDRYEWQFIAGKRHGQGSLRFANGDSYRGEFADDQINGFGHYRYATGDRYTGHLLGGRRHGLGRLVSGEGRAAQEGRWEHDRFVWPQAIRAF